MKTYVRIMFDDEDAAYKRWYKRLWRKRNRKRLKKQLRRRTAQNGTR